MVVYTIRIISVMLRIQISVISKITKIVTLSKSHE